MKTNKDNEMAANNHAKRSKTRQASSIEDVAIDKTVEVFCYPLKRGISRTKPFEEKRLAQYAVNVGTRCGHLCTYCSTPSMMRMHHAFKKIDRSPFAQGYAIVDPESPIRVKRDARHLQHRGLIQMCTIVDAWAPEAQMYNLERQCLEAILCEPDWSVRILTKNAAVAKDFDVIERHRDRVAVGLSITAPPVNSELIGVIEPGASLIEDRLAVIREAHQRGLRTYGMFCPLLPGIADEPEHIDELVQTAVNCGAEEIFVEAVNPRGPGLKLTEQVLRASGHYNEAQSIAEIRNRVNWSHYVRNLIRNTQRSMLKYSDIAKLRFLLYPRMLASEDIRIIESDDQGVVWLNV